MRLVLRLYGCCYPYCAEAAAAAATAAATETVMSNSLALFGFLLARAEDTLYKIASKVSKSERERERKKN